jgi:hypothetical protein
MRTAMALRKEAQAQPEGSNAQTEQQKANIQAHARWLAGLFEVGGTMSAQTGQRPDGATRADLYLQISDNNELRTRRLAEHFGGYMYRNTRPTTTTWIWTMVTDRARTVASAVQPYAPSRKPFIDLANKWDDLTADQRVSEARKIIASPRSERRAITNPQDYEHLVADPEFVAGVIDARGGLYGRPVPYQNAPRIQVATTNKALLAALQERYGGVLRTIGTQDTNTAPSGTVWRLDGAPAKALYPQIRPHLLLRGEDADRVFAEASAPVAANLPSRRAASVTSL